MDDAHGEDVPFAAVVATITSPAHGTAEHPRGTWQSGIPLCQSCSDRYQQEMPFGFYMVDRVLPMICQNCGLPSPCNDCDDTD
ncbi:hypothetical protein [Plantibacter flavus]|nr:hypothetical protein [Plantibacter flavus]